MSHDEKDIHPEKLNLPPSTPLTELLSLIPELMNEQGQSLFENYEVEIDDVSVDESRDIILANLKISDIDVIEITDSPIDNFEKMTTSKRMANAEPLTYSYKIRPHIGV